MSKTVDFMSTFVSIDFQNVFAMGFQKVGNDGTTRGYGTTGSPVFTPVFSRDRVSRSFFSSVL